MNPPRGYRSTYDIEVGRVGGAVHIERDLSKAALLASAREIVAHALSRGWIHRGAQRPLSDAAINELKRRSNYQRRRARE